MTTEVCDICGEKANFTPPENAPATCPACFNNWTPMKSDRTISSQHIQEDCEPGNLTLICQKSGKTINIPPQSTIVLGREAFGSEVLVQPQISRKHCMIEWISPEGYLVSDMNSAHGTYLGINRVDCRQAPKQKLNDGDILFMGREIYSIKLHTPTSHSESTVDNTINIETPQVRQPACESEKNKQSKKCEHCNISVEMTESIIANPCCPKCGCYNTSWNH